MLDEHQVGIIKGLLARGEKQQDIAAFFSCNSGRVAEVNTGKKFHHVSPAAGKDLPSSAEVASSYVIYLANQAIDRAMLGLQAAKAYLNDHEAAREARLKAIERTEALKKEMRKPTKPAKRS
jgi:hypothetical protein